MNSYCCWLWIDFVDVLDWFCGCFDWFCDWFCGCFGLILWMFWLILWIDFVIDFVIDFWLIWWMFLWLYGLILWLILWLYGLILWMFLDMLSWMFVRRFGGCFCDCFGCFVACFELIWVLLYGWKIVKITLEKWF